MYAMIISYMAATSYTIERSACKGKEAAILGKRLLFIYLP
jgi:hypothetical protein